MMNIAELAITKKSFFLFLTLVLSIAGVIAYFSMGKLEDPEFTIKTAVIITPYPGASPTEVENEVSDHVEKAVMRLDQLDYVQTESRPGVSIAHVHLKEDIPADEVPQHWDRLRHRIADIRPDLPPGAGEPEIIDDFGDVYGVLIALTGEDYSYSELLDYAEMIQKELLLADEVARVEIWGQQQETVFVDISRARLAELDLSMNQVMGFLESSSMAADAGKADLGRERVRFVLGGQFESVQDIRELELGYARHPELESMIQLGDIAEVRRGYLDPPATMIRHDGQKALAIGVSTVSGGNVVHMGQQVQDSLEGLQDRLPVGIQTDFVAFQADKVTEAINTFMLNLLQAVTIVILLLLVFMGIRSGLIIGSGLLLTILVTFTLMLALGMDMDRVSLGALIISLGMIVDNAIVVTEGMLVKIQTGTRRLQAAVESVRETGWPLLGATLVAVFAFMPIVLASDDTGEYTRGLFLVIAISLISSWILAMTLTPLWCHMFLRRGKAQGQEPSDPYAGRIYQLYRRLLHLCLRRKKSLLAGMALLFVLAVMGFYLVDKTFFPPSTRPQLKLDYWLPEGTRIHSTSQDLQKVEEDILKHPGVESVTSFIGEGAPRFYLAMEPHMPNPSFGQVILNLYRASDLDEVKEYARGYLEENYPHAQPRVRKFPMGPPVEFSVEVRFSGPDAQVLRGLARQAEDIMYNDPDSREVRSDWRQMVKTYDLDYSQSRGIRFGVTREDAARAVKLNFDGLQAGLYREGDRMLPIILRPPEESRQRLEDMFALDVRPMGETRGAPLGQVVSSATLGWEEGVIIRRDRQKTITAQCEADQGGGQALMERIRSDIEAIELPPGYRMQWGGEYEQSRDSQKEVFSGVPISFLFMALAVVALFNTLRQPLIIAMVLPLAMIGVTLGLLATSQPFGFMALLGTLSLSGMLIKNVVVLLDRIDNNLASGEEPYQGLVNASVSRLRPVMMATLSTVMGMTPLLLDIFWLSMAIAIICGLTFASVLTLLVAPVLYALFFGIKTPQGNT
ncbi:efflux RND transporter permease subunit [Desulfonatronospira sp. MSAO_Bac3]|uniref:efflux RND transporter permease subunit n=1 Tax=Desulfonatronospira sp. MSAO_Bac3 TaxID=2293857 RepID=UPI000FF2B16B|nr:efflux RND transporter permease subunit [Desulfonatronospira sp. MSAO_Bac3]RQD74370.1 MAG: efflux RND transporter permease subunit [Desulfonatronospira sp. MSAO_Bac3]